MESIVKKEQDAEFAAPLPPAGASSSSSGDQPKGGNIILNSTSEFCRSLGEIPTYGLSGNREEEREEIMVSVILTTGVVYVYGVFEQESMISAQSLL